MSDDSRNKKQMIRKMYNEVYMFLQNSIPEENIRSIIEMHNDELTILSKQKEFTKCLNSSNLEELSYMYEEFDRIFGNHY